MRFQNRPLFNSIKGSIFISAFSCIGVLLLMMITLFDGGYQNAEKAALSIFEADSTYISESLNESLQEVHEKMRNLAYNETVQRYLFTGDIIECMQFNSAANQLIDNVVDNSRIITHAFLLGRKRHVYSPAASLYYSLIEQFQKAAQEREDSGAFFSDIYMQNNKPYVFFIYPFVNTGDRSEQGLGIFCCDVSNMVGLLRQTGDEYSCMVIVQKGESILTSRTLEESERIALAAAYDACVDTNEESFIHSDHRFLTFISHYASLRCDIAVITHKSEIIIHILRTKWTIYLLLCLTCVAVSYVALRTARLISRQLQTMERDISRLSAFEEENGICVPSLRELNNLAQTINNMLLRLKQNAEEQKRAEKRELSLALALKQSELEFYRIQIRPHFLFNTLECISSMAQYDGNESLKNITQSLISTLRYAVYQREISSVRDEVGNARDYMCIMQERKPGKYLLRLSVGEEVLNVPMPSMLLQPLVGNAIKHGFSHMKKSPLIILIRGRMNGSRCILEVIDNGAGMSERKLIETVEHMKEERISEMSKQGIGLQNIFQRMKLTYGQDFSFTIESREGFYTLVQISFPMTISQHS